MTPDDIPDFLFRGAIVSVDGVERVLKDLCLAIPEDSQRFRKEDEVLVLQFKDGLITQYDPERVKEVHGRAPDFIRTGEQIFWREERRDMQKYNGVWDIESYTVTKDELRGLPKTQVNLSLRQKTNSTTTYLTQKFNALTIFPTVSTCDETGNRRSPCGHLRGHRQAAAHVRAAIRCVWQR